MYFSKQLHAKLNQAPRKAHFEDHTWIDSDQGKKINGRRSAPLAPHHQELQISRQTMSNYHDHQSRNGQQRNFDLSPNKQHRVFVLLKFDLIKNFVVLLIENHLVVQ